MKKLFLQILKYQSIKILKKYNPKIIAITGSIGKTSTKEAIKIILEKNFNVRASEKNYNNEIGVPLTIIGVFKSPNNSIFAWLKLFFKAFKLILIKNKNYPKILVLEMGADKQGDIKYLIEIAKPNIGVLTNIGPSHLENFGTMEKLAKEKRRIVTNLTKDDIAVINIDNELCKDTLKLLKTQNVLTYGFNKNAKVRAIEIENNLSNREQNINNNGLYFKIVYNGSAVPIYLQNMFGYGTIMTVLAGASVGIAMGMNLIEIIERLKEYKSPKGRMHLLNGIKNSIIIDDTYNASPESTLNSIDVLAKMNLQIGARKIAVLGDMLELGEKSNDGHFKVAERILNSNIDILVTVGKLGNTISDFAVSLGFNENNVFRFDDSDEAGMFLIEFILNGDIILVKGSQGVRMEKSVKQILLNKEDALNCLVRQSIEWL